jgi:hypothetical protein
MIAPIVAPSPRPAFASPRLRLAAPSPRRAFAVSGYAADDSAQGRSANSSNLCLFRLAARFDDDSD